MRPAGAVLPVCRLDFGIPMAAHAGRRMTGRRGRATVETCREEPAMTTQPYEIADGGRPTVQAGELSRDVAPIDGATGPDQHLPRGRSLDPPFGLADGWTDAHSEVARFVGECFAVGAVCGFVVEVARSTRRLRDG
jgi:hypothetical protein